MNYAEATAQLHALGPELATNKFTGGPQVVLPRRKFDLDHMRALCRQLGSPELRFPSVLIAGTNGKGSTAATLAAILSAAGYRTGLYTSPHLVRMNERVQLSTPTGLTPITDEDFARFYTEVDRACETLIAAGTLPIAPSFFERVTAVAFLAFAAAQVNLAVLEVGLGGRLDATNVVEPLLSVITDIALDHQEWLGETVAEIAREKCGILRPGGILITLPQHPEANQAIGEAAMALGTRGIDATRYLPPARRNGDPAGASLARNRYDLRVESPGGAELLRVDSPLAGEHQRRNLALAIATAVELREQHNFPIANSAIEAGIRQTVWPGRLELLSSDLLVDVAHNPAGAWTLRAALASLPESQPRTLIFSCVADKDLGEMSRILFPLFDSSPDGDRNRSKDHVILLPIASPRATPLDELRAAALRLAVPALTVGGVAEALTLARRVTPPGGLIVATGSVYLVGTVRQAILQPGPASE